MLNPLERIARRAAPRKGHIALSLAVNHLCLRVCGCEGSRALYLRVAVNTRRELEAISSFSGVRNRDLDLLRLSGNIGCPPFRVDLDRSAARIWRTGVASLV